MRIMTRGPRVGGLEYVPSTHRQRVWLPSCGELCGRCRHCLRACRLWLEWLTFNYLNMSLRVLRDFGHCVLYEHFRVLDK